MRYSSVLIGAVFAALSFTNLSAEVRIRNDPGGLISEHMHVYARLRDAGERVVIDGHCLSACTLVLGMIPRNRICVTRRARLGFHAAWTPDPYGNPTFSDSGTAALWNTYPSHIRRWIARKGGLRRKMLVLRGSELASMYPICR